MAVIWCQISVANSGTIWVVTETGPVSYMKDGKPAGELIDLAKAILSRANPAYKIDIFPWARAYNTVLTSKNTMLLPVIRTGERESLFRWVGCVNADVYHQLLEKLKFPSLFAVSHPELLLRMLEKGRVDAFVMTRDMLGFHCREEPLDIGNYHAELPLHSSTKPMCAVLSKLTGEAVFDAVQKSLEDIKSDGTFYLSDHEQKVRMSTGI